MLWFGNRVSWMTYWFRAAPTRHHKTSQARPSTGLEHQCLGTTGIHTRLNKLCQMHQDSLPCACTALIYVPTFPTSNNCMCLFPKCWNCVTQIVCVCVSADGAVQISTTGSRGTEGAAAPPPPCLYPKIIIERQLSFLNNHFSFQGWQWAPRTSYKHSTLSSSAGVFDQCC